MVWTPLKNISQLGWLFPIYGKIKNVPNHQPGKKTCPFSQTPSLPWLSRPGRTSPCLELAHTAAPQHWAQQPGTVNWCPPDRSGGNWEQIVNLQVQIINELLPELQTQFLIFSDHIITINHLFTTHYDYKLRRLLSILYGFGSLIQLSPL